MADSQQISGSFGEKLVLPVYAASSLFMVLASIEAIRHWSETAAVAAISLACLAPLLLTLFLESGRWLKQRTLPREVGLVLLLCILGFINICLSDHRAPVLKGMGLFLLSGVLGYASSFLVLKSRDRQTPVLVLWTGMFVLLCGVGYHDAFTRPEAFNRVRLLYENPIPAASTLILLSAGPLMLMVRNRGVLRWGCAVSLGLGAVLLLLIGQRGPLVCLIVMALIITRIRLKNVVLAGLVLCVGLGLGWLMRDHLPPAYQSKFKNWDGALIRLETYPLALDIMKDHPLFGIGFNASKMEYVPPDYRPRLYPEEGRTPFYYRFRTIDTLDNMLLSLFAEAGGLFSLVYLLLIGSGVRTIMTQFPKNPEFGKESLILAGVVIGFGLHSLTFDSLKYSHLNWLAHSVVGFAAHWKPGGSHEG